MHEQWYAEERCKACLGLGDTLRVKGSRSRRKAENGVLSENEK